MLHLVCFLVTPQAWTAGPPTQLISYPALLLPETYAARACFLPGNGIYLGLSVPDTSGYCVSFLTLLQDGVLTRWGEGSPHCLSLVNFLMRPSANPL